MKRKFLVDKFWTLASIFFVLLDEISAQAPNPAYAVVQTCGQREFVDPNYCATLPTPPLTCNLPQFCYTSTGQPQDLKCQQLPNDCLQKLQAAGIPTGGGGTTASGGSTPSVTASTPGTPSPTTAPITTTRPPTPPPTQPSTVSQPATTSRPQTPPPAPAPGVTGRAKNYVIISGYQSELGPPSIPTSLDGNLQQVQPYPPQNFPIPPQPQYKGSQRPQFVNYPQPQFKGFQQAPVPPQPQYKGFQPPAPAPQFQSKGFQGGFQQRSSACSDFYDNCSFMANPVQCGQVGSWMWQNCPMACGRC